MSSPIPPPSSPAGTGRSRLIGRLPDRQRVAVVLRVMDGEDFVRIADVMGVTEGNARKLVSRGLATLRGLLEEDRQND